MRNTLLILSFFPLISFGQKTYIPDNMFEYCLEGMGMGDGIALNDSVWTSAIDTLTLLDISVNIGTPIASLQGIEDFINLQHLEIKFMNIDSVDLSNNQQLTYVHLRDNNLISINIGYLPNLEFLMVDENQISKIDLTGAPSLRLFACQFNELNSLDVSNNILLFSLYCWDNKITSLNLSNNSYIEYLNCENNNLVELDIRNGNNYQMTEFRVQGNNDLYCINVDNEAWSNSNWNFLPNNNISPWNYFSQNCISTSIKEHIFLKYH